MKYLATITFLLMWVFSWAQFDYIERLNYILASPDEYEDLHLDLTTFMFEEIEVNGQALLAFFDDFPEEDLLDSLQSELEIINWYLEQ